MKFITDNELKALFQDFKNGVIGNMKAADHWASGKTASKIRCLVKEGRISMPSYIDTLRYGRKRGKYPYFKAIKQWAISKGLTFSNETELNRFVYFTTKKIGKLGTKQWRDRREDDIYQTPQEKLADAITTLEAERAEEELVNKYINSFDNLNLNI